ncbi:hypothetical protein [Hirschia litorea]|uniref:Lipoprotein n=1 Tax=Hirschia litorea TaxID=1199156 RepID=A0ABW2IKR9_9PROT
MSILKFAAILPVAVLATGCINVQANGHGDYGFYDAASVQGAVIANDEIHVTVSSNGCTDKSFIDADVERDGRDHFEVEFERIRDDHCKALRPEGETLTYSFQELGIPTGASVEIRNQVRK